MIIKKYIGKTAEEAEAKAKEELGKGYYVLYTRQLRKKWLAFLLPAEIEITVAKEDDTTKPNNHRKKPHRIAETSTKDSILEEKSISTQNIKTDITVKQENSALNIVPNVPKVEKALSIANDTDSNTKEPTDKSMSEEAYRFVKVLYKNLLASEVDEIFINELTSVAEKYCSSIDSLNGMLNGIYEKMVIKCGSAQPLKDDNTKHKLEIFLGPTGVGKTTTIAKIAGQLLMEQKKVVLATIDTYRIGAADQLQIYAERMMMPFCVIYTAEELIQIINFYSDYDYILLDTAGHNFRNEELRNQMFSIIKPVIEHTVSDIFLVLSSTTSYKELLDIADSYSEYFDYKVIYTKIDEKPVLGNLYNLRMHTGAPISYLTFGQNVPSDIRIFNPQGLVKALIGAQDYVVELDSENKSESNE